MNTQYSVVMFFCDGSYEYEARFIDAYSAVKLARDITLRVCCRTGIVDRVIITDGGDCIAFEWTFRDGVTYPTPEIRRAVDTPPDSDTVT